MHVDLGWEKQHERFHCNEKQDGEYEGKVIKLFIIARVQCVTH